VTSATQEQVHTLLSCSPVEGVSQQHLSYRNIGMLLASSISYLFPQMQETPKLSSELCWRRRADCSRWAYSSFSFWNLFWLRCGFCVCRTVKSPCLMAAEDFCGV